MNKTNKWLTFVGLVCITAAVAVSLGISSKSVDSKLRGGGESRLQTPQQSEQQMFFDVAQLPNNLTPCFSDRQISEHRIWGESGRYKLIGVKEGEQWWEAIVSVEGHSCQILTPAGQSFSRALSAYVPESVAIDLARQRYEKAIELAGGRDAFQADFQAHVGDPIADTYLPQEYLEALKQLGIQVPDNVVPVDRQGVD